MNYYYLMFVNHNSIGLWATPNNDLHTSHYCNRPIGIAHNLSAFSTRLRFLHNCRATMDRPSDGLYRHHVWFFGYVARFSATVSVIIAMLVNLFSKQYSCQKHGANSIPGILAAMLQNIHVFWNVTSCRRVNSFRHFGG